MTREETKRIIQIMVETYPNYKPNNLSNTVDIWCSLLEEYDYREIGAALKSYILTNNSGFAPSVGQLVNILAELKNKASATNQLTSAEAWGLVTKALRRSSYYSDEEYAKLPTTIQKCVGSSDQLRIWATDSSFNEGVESSNFKRAYETQVEREKTEAMLPSSVREFIALKVQEGEQARIGVDK